MNKFEQIKMIELVKVEDPDSDGGITLVFQENKILKIKIVDGKLVSQFDVSLLTFDMFFIESNS